MSPPSLRSFLPEIEKYFKDFDPSLPSLILNGNGEINLTDSLGNPYQEVDSRWRALLSSVARNHHESPGSRLTVQDWLTHKKSLKFGNSGRVVLPNGAQVITDYRPDLNFVTVGFALFVGSADQEGEIPHLLEHTVMANPLLGQNRREFEKKMTNLGAAKIAVNTHHTRTLYSFYVEPIHLKEMFTLWSSVLVNENYNEKEFADGLKVMESELRNLRSDGYSSIWNFFQQRLYPDHPWGFPPTSISNFEQLKRTPLAEVKRVHSEKYQPNNMTILFRGPIRLSEAVKIVQEDEIGKMASKAIERAPISLRSDFIPTLEILSSNSNREIPPTKTTQVKIGWRAPMWLDRDEAALHIAFRIMNNRLDEKLVKTGKLQRARISSKGNLDGIGPIVLTLIGSADQIENGMIEAQSLITQMSQHPADNREIKSVNREYLALDAFQEEETSNKIFEDLEDSRYVDPIGYRRLFTRELSRVNSQRIQKVVQKYLSTVGDYTVIVLEEGKVLSDFPSSERLFSRMRAVRSQKIAPYVSDVKTRADYPKVVFPQSINLSALLNRPFQQLSDGRFRCQMKNGMTVTYLPIKGKKIIVSQIRSSLGNATDPEGKEGLRELVQNNLFRGTDRISSNAFKQEMNFFHANFDADTDTDGFTISFSAFHENFLEAAQLFLYVIQHPRLGKDDLEETKLALNGSRQIYENDSKFISRYIPAFDLYPNFAVNRLSIGTEATVGNISRDDLIDYHQQLFDPTKLEVTLAGHFANKSDFEKILFLLSKIPSRNLPVKFPEQQLNTPSVYPFDVRRVTDRSILAATGISEDKIEVTYTPRNIDSVYFSQQTLGPSRDSWEYPFFHLFRRMFNLRLFGRLIDGIKEGRDPVKGYLYHAEVSEVLRELNQPVLGRYYATCRPDQLKQVLADFNDEYLQTVSKHLPTQSELMHVIALERMDWLSSLEKTSGRMIDSVNKDHYPYFFRNPDGSVDKVDDRREVFRRFSQLSIKDIIEIGGKPFNPKKPSTSLKKPFRLHIVGKLPEK